MLIAVKDWLMNRHQRRKRARLRKNEKALHLNNRALLVLQQERERNALSDPRRPARSPKGLGNYRIYSGSGLIPMKGFGTGAFKSDTTSLSDRELHKLHEKFGAPKE